MTTVSLRYIVEEIDEATAFSRDHLGFTVEMHAAPALAMLLSGDLRLLLSAPPRRANAAAHSFCRMVECQPGRVEPLSA
jgi:hypothetical protein